MGEIIFLGAFIFVAYPGFYGRRAADVVKAYRERMQK